MAKLTRREFIKNTVITGLGITAFPMVFVPKARAHWALRTRVHPNVDNLCVVGITDPKMTRRVEKIPQSWARQEKLVNNEVVRKNLDKMACSLVSENDPEIAWRAIFVKPPFKSWKDTVIAIKTNCLGRQHTHSAIMAKLCHVLTDILGVDPYNINIYDARHGMSMCATPFQGLPEGVNLAGYWDGITASTSVPSPWQGKQSNCLGPLVYGTVDILINISMCKGHSPLFGNFTMTMKNHFGTFAPSHGHGGGQSGLDYLLAINQTPEILGKMDAKTGNVLYPRQQLCLVDSLWASEAGPWMGPSHQPNFLAMGVFSPVVDYLVATQFRGQKMGWPPNMDATFRMLSAFGYSENDLPYNGQIIEL